MQVTIETQDGEEVVIDDCVTVKKQSGFLEEGDDKIVIYYEEVEDLRQAGTGDIDTDEYKNATIKRVSEVHREYGKGICHDCGNMYDIESWKSEEECPGCGSTNWTIAPISG